MKIFTFQTSVENPLSDHMSGNQASHGLSIARHKGQFLVATTSKSGNCFLDMHIVKSRKAKIFDRCIAYGVYPVNGYAETLYRIEDFKKPLKTTHNV